MGGRHMISISAAVRTATGLTGGDPVRVTPTVADTPQQVTLPAGPAAALAADEQASAFFGRLSNSMQRYHAGHIAAAKSAGTRQRERVEELPHWQLEAAEHGPQRILDAGAVAKEDRPDRTRHHPVIVGDYIAVTRALITACRRWSSTCTCPPGTCKGLLREPREFTKK